MEEIVPSFGNGSVSSLEEKQGLSTLEVEKRLLKYGLNTINVNKSVPFLSILIKQFTDLLIILLLIASLLSFVLGDLRNGFVILSIVILNSVIGFTQEYKAQQVLKALNKMLPQMVRVKRNGKEKMINAHYLTVGDIVILSPGDRVPADLKLIESYDLTCDEKTLTGEAHPQSKFIGGDEKESLLFMGTTVISGEAEAEVVSVGITTEFGKIAELATEIKKDLSPLQKKVNQIAKKVAILAVFIVIGLVVYKYLSDQKLIDSFIYAIAVAAALVPEGLPATISVALSIGASNLAKKKALVRNLVAVETLGSVTLICTDKTGTLTTGDMEVKELWLNENPEINSSQIERLLTESMILCNDAQYGEESIGDSTEVALLKWVDKHGHDFEKIKKEFQRIHVIPFSSHQKFMTVKLKKDGREITFSKGAPEVILSKCIVDEAETERINKKFNEFAKEGFRVLAFSYNEIFLGLASIYDPPRDEAKKAIEDCKSGHVKVLMLTGDSPLTAVSIAKMTGLTYEEEPYVVTGKEIEEMSDIKLRDVLLGEPIFARVLPEHKYRIVDNLINMGEIVAVTGDGVNDAPALKRADIGIAMGKTGTDVSREAADMVLLDDNFATIVHAIKEGRVIFDNAKKFLFYLFSANFGELLTIILGGLLGLPLPITAIHILIIDLGTDVLPSMSLIFDPSDSRIMKTKPRAKNIQLLEKKDFVHLAILALVMGTGAILGFVKTLDFTESYIAATTTALTILVFSQLVNAFLARTPQNSIFKLSFFSNKFLIISSLISVAMILVFIYNGFLNRYLQTSAIPSFTIYYILSTCFFLILAEEVYKCFQKN